MGTEYQSGENENENENEEDSYSLGIGPKDAIADRRKLYLIPVGVLNCIGSNYPPMFSIYFFACSIVLAQDTVIIH